MRTTLLRFAPCRGKRGFQGRAGFLGLACALLLGVLVVATPGCARDLHARTTAERINAAEIFRTEATYDLTHGRTVEAVVGFREAVRQWPRDAESLWALARVYGTVGYPSVSAGYAARALDLDPEAYAGRDPLAEPVPLVHDPLAVAAVLTIPPVPAGADLVSQAASADVERQRPPATPGASPATNSTDEAGAE